MKRKDAYGKEENVYQFYFDCADFTSKAWAFLHKQLCEDMQWAVEDSACPIVEAMWVYKVDSRRRVAKTPTIVGVALSCNGRNFFDSREDLAADQGFVYGGLSRKAIDAVEFERRYEDLARSGKHVYVPRGLALKRHLDSTRAACR